MKINNLLLMDDLKSHSRNEKELDSLVQTMHIFSEDIRMEFGIEKSERERIEKGKILIEKGKIVKSVGTQLPVGKVIKSLQEGESYKFLGILEAEKILGEKMKLEVSK